MKFNILPVDYKFKGTAYCGYTAEVIDIDTVDAYKATGVGITITEAVDDALVELIRIKEKIKSMGG